ncbi:MAG: late competence development ComFB family protein [Termitinemataceae bacterium]|nr:MAG: late competence development ComFB family protein [Termitinemataceae bacterium]
MESKQIHNIMEDIVNDEVAKACAAVEKEKDVEGICTCAQCRLDTACYVLNRISPTYIVSSRGLVREDQFTLEKQQKIADITTLVYTALKQIGHNKRAFFDHDQKEFVHNEGAFFNFPAIVGRIFDGGNFTPMDDTKITLFIDGKEALTKDANWPNPCFLISKTEGTYTFWAKSLSSKKAGTKKKFAITLEAESPGMDILHHRFEIPLTSASQENTVFSMASTHKIADLYMFAQGSGEAQ